MENAYHYYELPFACSIAIKTSLRHIGIKGDDRWGD